MTVIWVNGRFLGSRDLAISPLDRGLTVGEGVFETCLITGGRVFAITRHLRRLSGALDALGIAIGETGAELRAALPSAVQDVMLHYQRSYGQADGRLRITVTSGIAQLGTRAAPAPEPPTPTVTIAAAPESLASKTRVVRSPWVRNERSPVVGLKTISYVDNTMALQDARKRGADEALLANTVGELCEGTTSNVFVEMDGELLTPGLGSGCLPGITRELVLEWGVEAGLPIREACPGELPFTVLDEIAAGGGHLAVSSSGCNLQPVIWLDGATLTQGPLSITASDLMTRLVPERIDP